MKTNLFFEAPEFVENPVFEQIIDDLLVRKYSAIDHFFSADEVTQLRISLLKKNESLHFKKAAIGNKINETIKKEVRGDYIFWLNKETALPAEKIFLAKIEEMITYFNQTCFMGIVEKEFHYAIYPTGTYYRRHLDVFQGDDRRKLSVVCYLNDADWEKENGGELVLYPNKNGQEHEIVIHPFPGKIVIFESQVLEHEVKPVLKAERLSITGWLKTR